jgi:hypothetical protein
MPRPLPQLLNLFHLQIKVWVFFRISYIIFPAIKVLENKFSFLSSQNVLHSKNDGCVSPALGSLQVRFSSPDNSSKEEKRVLGIVAIPARCQFHKHNLHCKKKKIILFYFLAFKGFIR